MSYGSGTGNSYQSDYAKCERFFFHKHRNALRAKASGEAVALAVGTALHAWLQAFYEAEMRGENKRWCGDLAHTAFYDALKDVGRGENLDTAELDKRAMTALSLLNRRSDEIWRRLNDGVERTIACELHLTLTLPETFNYDGRALAIRPELQQYTVQIDRLFDQMSAEEWDGPVRVVEDYKSTSSSSPATYIEQCLMNDQSTGYVYAVNKWIAAGTELDATRTALAPEEPAGAIRYSGWRVKGPVESAAAYAELTTPVSESACTDWYKRLLLARARMSAQWDDPRDMWLASRYAHGPCTQFYRQCEFWGVCSAPGDEERVIEEEYEVVPDGDRAPA